jgi:4'-phosphopantetheinyl transferase
VTEALAIDVVLVEVEPHRASAIVAMAARVAVGSRLGVYPTLVAIDHDSSGRPVVEGVALSLSHSGTLGAVAIADPGVRIGVDLEAMRARRHVDRIARRVFTATEHASWTALDDAARPLALLARWTEVEAVLKAQGTGIAGGFANAVPIPDGWSCASIDAGPGFVAAVAADAPAIDVRVAWFQRS